MSIDFHCEYCGRHIKAPDDAGGKRGICPNCKNSVYVPVPREQVEEIPLAPVDDEEERRRQELDRQARAVQEALLHERDAPPEGPRSGAPASGPPPGARAPQPSVHRDPRQLVLDCIRALAQSKLDRVETLISEMRRSGAAARHVVEELSLDDIPPPELSNVPAELYQGFLRTIRHRLA